MILMLTISLSFFLVSILSAYASTILIKNFVDISNIYSTTIWKSYSAEENVKLEKLAADKSYVRDFKIYDAVSVDKITLINENVEYRSPDYFLIAHESENNKIYSVDENEEISLNAGEIAIPLRSAKALRIQIGDKISININGRNFEFTVKYIFKDVLFGSEYISTKRLVIGESDLLDILDVCSPNCHYSFVGINMKEGSSTTDFISALTEYEIPIIFKLDRDFLMQVYGASNGIIAMLFLVAALFIGIILFFIQRYSIYTTVEDEYPHIGLMKAMGFQDKQIIAIYFGKYLLTDIFGMLAGIAVGTLLARIFLSSYFEYVVVQNWFDVWTIVLFCTVLAGTGYAAISYLCLLRISKLSPIETKDSRRDEKKDRVPMLSLYKRPWIDSKFILSVNDLAQNHSHFFKIVATLLLGVALMLTLGNLKSTIAGEEFISYFGVTVGDIYREIPVEDRRPEEINEMVAQLNEKLINNNENAFLMVDFYVSGRIVDESGVSSQIMSVKSSVPTSESRFIRGTAPKGQYEIALTNVLAQRYQKNVGDTIILEIEGEKNEYRVTAINQALYNMGELILLSNNYEIKGKPEMCLMIAFTDSPNKEDAISKLQNKYEFLNGYSARDVINKFTGNMVNQIVIAIDVLMVFDFSLILIVLILFIKMLCYKESPILQQLHAIGADDSYLFRYQMVKSGIFIIASTLLGVICAVTMGKFVVIRLFSLTGLARFELITNVVNTFLFLPAAFMLIALFVTGIVLWRFIKKLFFNEEG